MLVQSLVRFVLIFLKINGEKISLNLLLRLNTVCYYRAAAMTIRTVLLSLQALLATPEPDDPQDAGNIKYSRNYLLMLFFVISVVATQYKKDRKLFEKTARHWSNVYANGK
jgi:ubiquitin-protein ligase